MDEILHSKAAAREQILYDAGTTEIERKDFRNALTALKDCIGSLFIFNNFFFKIDWFLIDYFSHGGTNDNGRFYWHTEIPTVPSSRPHRLSDTGKRKSITKRWIFFFVFQALPTPPSTEPARSTSVSSSISTEFGTTTNNNNNNQMTVPLSPHARRNNGK